MENMSAGAPAPQSSGAPSASPASNKKLWILVIVILVLTFGCMAMRRASWFVSENMIERAIERSAGDNADVDVDLGGNTTITTDQGTMTFGSNKTPDNWPSDIDLPKDIQITFSGSANPESGEEGSYMSYTTKDSIEDVMAYYKKELDNEGWKTEQTTTMGTAAALGAKKDSRTFGMWAATSGELTMVTIGVSEENN